MKIVDSLTKPCDLQCASPHSGQVELIQKALDLRVVLQNLQLYMGTYYNHREPILKYIDEGWCLDI